MRSRSARAVEPTPAALPPPTPASPVVVAIAGCSGSGKTTLAAELARTLGGAHFHFDDYYLDLGAEAFRNELTAIGVTDVEFELFDATHMAIEYRYPLSLAYLARRLAP